MKRNLLLASSILALALSVNMESAVAQQGTARLGPMMPGGPMARGMDRMMGMGDCPMMNMMTGELDMPTFAQGRVAFLKAELAITDAQSKAWEAYAEALKKNLQNMQDMRQPMMSAMMGKTPVERLDAHLTAMENRLKVLKDVKPALGALYQTLSDDQRKKADQVLTSMGCMM